MKYRTKVIWVRPYGPTKFNSDFVETERGMEAWCMFSGDHDINVAYRNIQGCGNKEYYYVVEEYPS